MRAFEYVRATDLEQTLHHLAQAEAGALRPLAGGTDLLTLMKADLETPTQVIDIKRLGDQTPPDGPILAVQTADLGEKEAVLAAGHAGVFTIAHFNGYPAVLLQLRVVERTVLRELIVDGWLACAPAALAEQYVRRHRLRPARPDAG